MDIENINPPYFGKRMKKHIKNENPDKGEGDNTEMRVGFKFKGRQIDLIDTEEQLPKLEENLTFP